MFSNINEFVAKRVALTKCEYDYFNNKLHYKTFKKKEIILEPGTVCNFEGYVLKGLFRMYCINESGNETDLLFASEDWWIGDLISFSQRIPSKLYISFSNCRLIKTGNSFLNASSSLKEIPLKSL